MLPAPNVRAAVALCLLAACRASGGDDGAADDADGSAAGTVVTAPAPGVFTGTLPCADCPGRAVALVIHQDGRFAERTTYEGRTADDGSPAVFADIGRWELRAPDGLLLDGGREAAVRWAVLHPDTLLATDVRGAPLPDEPRHRLVRDPAAAVPAVTLELPGEFVYVADAGAFRACADGHTYPVPMDADWLALERGYLAARTAPQDTLLVWLAARIERRSREDGGPLDVIVAERFLRAEAGRCPSKGVRP